MQKICTGCNEVKDFSEFSKRTGTNRPISKCKSCERIRSNKYSISVRKTPYGSYLQQKANAKTREIDFKLSYEEWLNIWEDSGKLHLRGRGKGKYCMCRIGDLGIYEVGNVFIDLCTYNTKEGNIGKKLSEETRLKIAKANTGKPHPWSVGKNNPMHRQEVKDKISLATSGENHYNQRGIDTPYGYFPTAKAAAIILGIKQPTVEWRARNNKLGFSYHKPKNTRNQNGKFY